MKKHQNIFSDHCIYKIAEILNHDFLSLPVISPELANKLETLHYKFKGKNNEGVSKEYYFSIDIKNNELLMEMLKVLQHLKKKGITMSEENIRFLLAEKLKEGRNLHFWLVLRIAIYELDYM